jgi:glycosyltransferase involved in cell wall biosynthesis
MHVLYLNYQLDRDLQSADMLLQRYSTMTEWCIALKREGVERVSIVQAFHNDQIHQRAGVEFHFVRAGIFPSVPAWMTPGRIHAKVCGLSPDVVHHSGHVYPLSHLRSTIGPATALLWQHRGGNPSSFPGMLLKRRGFLSVDGFLFSAKECASSWGDRGIIRNHQQIYEIMGGSSTCTPIETEQAKRELGLSGALVFLWVGRLNSNKDPLTVIRGFALAVKTLPDAHLFMIYQDSQLLSAVHGAIRDLHLDANVHLLGRITGSEIVRYYRAADFFLLGSHQEATGFAVLEAMACGVVPIVTDIPSFRRMTANGTIGSLWQPGKVSSLVSAIQNALEKKTMRSSVRKYFLDHWSFGALARQAIRVYDDAYRRRNPLPGMKAP